MSELKPCPFCGEKDVRIVEHTKIGEIYVPKGYYVNCLCGARFYSFSDKQKAIEAWNRRVSE